MISFSKPVFLLCFLFLAFRGVEAYETDYYQQDPVVGHVHKAYATRVYDWPEHANGKIFLKTNNFGFREDGDTKINKEKGVARIIITGDSHTDGVVNNNESFSNLLEVELNAKNQPARFEVINGGVGYYSFDQYLLFLKKFLFLHPEMYIVSVYIGNDFLDTARILEAAGDFNVRPQAYLKSLKDCACDGLMDQSMNQIYYFKNFPQMMPKTVRRCREIILKISQLCKLRKIDLLVLFIPTKADVEWQKDAERLGKIKECLGLEESDLRINQDLKEELIKGLSKDGVAYLDFTEEMKNQQNELYWKKDYHLSDKGHKLIADKLYEKYSVSLYRMWQKRCR